MEELKMYLENQIKIFQELIDENKEYKDQRMYFLGKKSQIEETLKKIDLIEKSVDNFEG